MRIAIDASRAVKKIRNGPENYSYEIINAILRLKTNDDFTLYAPHLPHDEFADSDRINWSILPQQRLWSQVKLARELGKDKPDVLFVPSHVVPIISKLPTVVTIHDLAFKYFASTYSRFELRYQNFSTGVSVSKAKRVIVPSEATLRDLLKFYPTAKNKTKIIYHGYDRSIFVPDRDESNNPMSSPYILYVGRIEEKKNIRLLVDAFALLCKEKKEINLVLAGKNGYGFENVQAKISSMPEEVKRRIFQPGHLTQYDMIRYLQNATLFAFPSHYEGFGLSVLEAMATGLPIVCSNTSSLPEITGSAAVLLPPTKPLQWAGAFSRIFNQPKFADELSRKSLKQAARFSWEKAAEETYKTIVDAGKK